MVEVNDSGLGYTCKVVRSAIFWIHYVWHKCPRTERILIFINFCISILSIAVGATAPLIFSDIINKTSETNISIPSILLSAASFVFLRFVGQAILDLRWIMINPILYKVVYRYALELVERVIQSSNDELRIHQLAEISESVAIIEKAQNSLMTLVQNVVVLVIPVVIEVIVMIIVTATALGSVSPLLILVSVVASGSSILFYARKESKELTTALDADIQLSREVGHSIGLSPLINEFNCFPCFQSRLLERVNLSVVKHRKYFFVKTSRALLSTIITSLFYAGVLLFFISSSGSKINSGYIFLVLAYMDRLVTPIGKLALAVIGIQNSIVGLSITDKLFSDFKNNHLGIESDIKIVDEKIYIFNNYEYWPKEGIALRKGDRILISGLSGSGKSSLLTNIFECFKEKFENQLVARYLPEKPYIFDGNIGENLYFHDEYISCANIWDDFWKNNIHSHTPDLKQSASSLSAGETQLLGFLRAIQNSPDILFIDEGLSSMDVHLESSVLKEINDNFLESIVFLVSHRKIDGFNPNIVINISNRQVSSIELKHTNPLCGATS